VRASRHKNFVNKRTPADAFAPGSAQSQVGSGPLEDGTTDHPGHALKKFVPMHWTTSSFERIKRLWSLFI
jgi:hypothetical protein